MLKNTSDRMWLSESVSQAAPKNGPEGVERECVNINTREEGGVGCLSEGEGVS